MLNLISNAAQAIENSGKILVETFISDGYVHVAIQDNGKGIAKETMPKIFDPFFTTKAMGEGSGMGLSICYKIIQQHNGLIKVQSKEGRGTRFTVKLPIQQTTELKLAV